MSKGSNSVRTGNIWTIAIGLVLFIWGTVSLVLKLVYGWDIPGTPWLMLPGGVMIIAGIANIITYGYNKEKVLGALKSYERVSISQLASELGMKHKDIKDAVVDLRTEGRLKASFDPESGDTVSIDDEN